jgi:hypothetical protein
MNMKDNYIIADLNPRKNPYVEGLKCQAGRNLYSVNIERFTRDAGDIGTSYQNLIDLRIEV